MGTRTFKPRYKFSKDGYATAVTGIHEDDFEAILKLCAGQQTVEMPEGVTHVREHRRDVATGMLLMSENAVRRGGRVTVKFTQKLTAGVVESIFTGASLEWTRVYDPKNHILVRRDNLLAPNRYGDMSRLGEKYAPAPPPEIMRVYYTLEALRKALDDHRRQQFPSWRGPKRGVFFPVMLMGTQERIARIHQTRERIAESKRWEDLLTSAIKTKIQKKAEANVRQEA